MWSGPVAATKSYQTCSSQSDPEDGHRIRTPKNLHCHIHDRMNALEWSFQRELEMCFQRFDVENASYLYKHVQVDIQIPEPLPISDISYWYLHVPSKTLRLCWYVSYCVILCHMCHIFPRGCPEIWSTLPSSPAPRRPRRPRPALRAVATAGAAPESRPTPRMQRPKVSHMAEEHGRLGTSGLVKIGWWEVP